MTTESDEIGSFSIAENAEIYGINPELEVFYGHDGVLRDMHPRNVPPEWCEDGEMQFASKARKHELADRMIALWTAYKEAAQ